MLKQIIPKSFQLYGRTIKVKDDEHLKTRENASGVARYYTSEVILQKPCKDFPILQETREATFCHELVHQILFVMGNRDLNDDEVFVDTFGQLLHQYFKTAKFSKQKGKKK